MRTIYARFDRSLWIALAISLALHAALLATGLFSWETHAPKVVSSIQVRLNTIAIAPPETAISPSESPTVEETIATIEQPATIPPAVDLEPASLPVEAAPSANSQFRVPLDPESIRSFVSAGEARDPTAFDSLSSVEEQYRRQWHQRVQRIGQLNYPTNASRLKLSGQLTLRVAINTDGSLASVGVAQSSGHDELDFAALDIVRQSAPFDPLPTNLPRTDGQFRFASTWEFRR